MILKNQHNDTKLSDTPEVGWIEITAEELKVIHASRVVIPVPEDPDIVRLRDIDAESQLTPRAFRELVMLVTEGFKQATGGALDLSVIPGVAQAFRAEAEAAVIRAKLAQGQ